MYKVGDWKWMKEGPQLRNSTGIPAVHETLAGSRRKLHLDLK
jgi:hypothetical protein